MQKYAQLSIDELSALQKELLKKYEDYKKQGLHLDMSRGKPGSEQLDISDGLLRAVSTNSETKAGTVDTRNYGGLDGLTEMKEIFSEMLGVSKSEIIVGGNSSLNMMFDTVSRAMTHGILGSAPWAKLDKVKFLCPVPGYDRHFGICQAFDIEMINVRMTKNGPDMDQIEALVETDSAIKGIWCVPKYSNPEGITYSDEVVRRFAALKPAAADFRIFWDNAYCVHDLTDHPDVLLNLLNECKTVGNPNLCYIYSSTSKISYPGGGVAVFASSEENINATKNIMKYQTIGPDKINQLRHVRYFKNLDGIKAHMKKHAAIIRPKFELVLAALQRELCDLDIADWVSPKGGYFISLNVMPGCAKNVHKLLADAGVVMTNVGATFPYGKDPLDTNLRIAPTYPSVSDLTIAADMLCLCVKLAAVNKLLKEKSEV